MILKLWIFVKAIFNVYDGELFIIKYCSKEELGPRFGRVWDDEKIRYIEVREDLPKMVQNYVKFHETIHFLTQLEKVHRLVDEFITLVVICPIFKPFGTVATLLCSLTPERLNFYRETYLKKGFNT